MLWTDPFLVISRVREKGDYVPVLKTEVIKKTLDPHWKPLSTTYALLQLPSTPSIQWPSFNSSSVQKLCNGDYDRPLQVECFDWNRSGKQVLIGQFKV